MIALQLNSFTMRSCYLLFCCLLSALAVAQAPTAAAPAPTVNADSVLSVYSNAYDNVPVDAIFTPWSNAMFADTVIDGSNMLRYTNLGFAGIETVGENALDLMAAGMTTVHFDIWSPNIEDFGFKLVDFGGTGFDPQGDNTEAEVRLAIAQGEWVGVDLPLSDFAAMNMTDINQIVISASPFEMADVFLDNIYFYNDGSQTMSAEAPTVAAPAPQRDAANVVSVYSNAYDNVPVDAIFTPWSNAAFADTTIDGSNMLRYTNLGFAGIELLGDNALDLVDAGATFVHFDVWTPNAEDFGFKLVDFGGTGFDPQGDNTEAEVRVTPANGSWVSYDLPLSDFAGMNFTDISQIVISASPFEMTTLFLDNIYFYNEPDALQQIDLPITFEDDNVDYGLADFGGNASMIVEDPTDATNTVAQSTKTAGAMVWAGTTLTSVSGGPDGLATAIPFSEDASVITVRVWSPAAGTPVLLKAEKADDPTISVETLTPTTRAMEWDTLTFEFKNQADGTAAINYDNVYSKLSIFFNFGTMPAADETYFWDDIVFTGTTTTGGNEDMVPMVGAPDPTRNADSVISLFSGVYTDVAVDTWRTEWSNSDFMDVDVDGNATKLYTNLGFVGIETVAMPLDVTASTHLHLDYWTPNMDTLLVKLVDFGGTGFDPQADNTEFELAFPVAQNGWNGIDIPLADFVGMNFSDINQLILSGRPFGASTLYLDNVYFYTERPSSVGRPELGVLSAFPNPATDRFTVTAPARIDQLEVTDMNGRRVAVYQPRSERFDVPTSELAPGLYVVTAAVGERRLVVKLLRR